MADQDTGGTPGVATLEVQDAAPNPETAQEEAQPEVLTVQHLRDEVARLQQEMRVGWSAAESAATKAAQAAVERHNAELRAELRETRATLDELSAGLLTEEQVQELRARQKTRQLEAENAALKAPAPTATWDQMKEYEYGNFVFPRLSEIAEANGLVYATEVGTLQQGVERLKPGESWEPFIAEQRRRIVALAAERKRVNTPTPRAETTRAGGGGSSAKSRYDAWLKGQGPKPSDAEIDSLTQKYATMR